MDDDRRPGRLERCRAAPRGNGAILTLADGRELAVEPSVARLAALLEQPLLTSAPRDVDVYPDALETTPDEWERLRALVLAYTFGHGPRTAAHLAMSAAELAVRPQRVYAGTDQGRTLYLSLPMNFRRRGTEHYALLDDGDEVWKVWVDLAAGRVRIEHGRAPGHYVRD